MNLQEASKERLILGTIIAGIVLMHGFAAFKANKVSRESTKQKREQYRNTLPFLNPISYEKPIQVKQDVYQ